MNYKRGGFISNDIYFAAWYPRYKDELLSMNRNKTLKNGGKQIDFLNRYIGNK